MVETPGDDEDVEAPTDLWLKIHEEVLELTQDLEVFDVDRAERSLKHREEVAMLEAQLKTELLGLETERERLADALVGYVQLRSQHLTLQRKHAEEMEVLKSCNQQLMSRTEELSSRGRQNVEEVTYLCKRDATDHIEYRRVAEMLERQHIGVAKACFEDVCETGEARVAELQSETRALKDRCAASRRRRKLALDGLRADLSLVAKKLAVLEQVAEQVNSSLGQACSGGGVDTQRQPPPRSRRGASSPYAQRPLASPFAKRPSSHGVQSCSSVARRAWRGRSAASQDLGRGTATR